MKFKIAAALLLSVASAAHAAAGRIGLYGTVRDSEAETVAYIDKCREAGVGVLLPSLSGGGTVIWKTDKAQYYPSLQAKLDGGYDALESLIRNAHRAGIKVIPSVAIGPGGRIIDQNPQWETRDRNGNPSGQTTTPSITFAYPEARAAKVALLMDLVNNYQVDGVLLDYCRYPENNKTPEARSGFYGYDEPFLERCRNEHGFDPRQVSIDSKEFAIFNQMRIDSVTAFVREFRDAVKATGKPIRVAGFGDTDPEVEAQTCARDWAGWGKAGLIDDFYLATYTEKGEQLGLVTQRARRALGPNVQLHAALTPFNRFVETNDQMVDHAKLLMAAGATDLWVYRDDFLEQLQLWDGVKSANQVVIAATPRE